MARKPEQPESRIYQKSWNNQADPCANILAERLFISKKAGTSECWNGQKDRNNQKTGPTRKVGTTRLIPAQIYWRNVCSFLERPKAGMARKPEQPESRTYQKSWNNQTDPCLNILAERLFISKIAGTAGNWKMPRKPEQPESRNYQKSHNNQTDPCANTLAETNVHFLNRQCVPNFFISLASPIRKEYCRSYN
jgi:hypothetical protein